MEWINDVDGCVHEIICHDKIQYAIYLSGVCI